LLRHAICEALACGERLKAICSNTAMPAASTVRKWALDIEHPLAARYEQARKIGVFEIVDEMLELADETKGDFLPGRTAAGRKVADEKAITMSSSGTCSTTRNVRLLFITSPSRV
jgi:hypothetical protein